MPLFLSERASLNSMTVSRSLPPFAALGLAGNSLSGDGLQIQIHIRRRGFVGLTPFHHQPTLSPPPSLQLFPLSSHSRFDSHTADFHIQLTSYQQQYARLFHCLLIFLWSETISFNRQQQPLFLFPTSQSIKHGSWRVQLKAFSTGPIHLSPTDTTQSSSIHTVSKISPLHLSKMQQPNTSTMTAAKNDDGRGYVSPNHTLSRPITH